MKSFGYYIILFVLRIKGIKKIFSVDPIDVNKVRKDDQVNIPGSIKRKFQCKTFDIKLSKITEIKPKTSNKKIILFIPGGAFISGPVAHHWATCAKLSKQSNSTLWMVNYPKAPEFKIDTICENLDAIYSTLAEEYMDHKIVIVGDSAGGSLAISLGQRLARANSNQASLIIAVSPVMDASMTNPQIQAVDEIDPMLGQVGVRSAKNMCAVNENLSDPKISPLNASFKGLPRTLLFMAEHDVTFPDQQLAVQKMQADHVDVEAIVGEKMMHIWPFLPALSEGKIAIDQMLNEINSIS